MPLEPARSARPPRSPSRPVRSCVGAAVVGVVTSEGAGVEPLTCSAALTHHWLVRRRGGEKVLEALAELLPGAAVYTLVLDRAGLGDSPLASHEIHASWLQRLPGAARYYPRLLPLMPAAAARMRLPDVELVVCSDAALAKCMTAGPGSRVVCYCHSPMRYVYEEAIREQYVRSLSPPLRPLFRRVVERVRAADQAAARRVDVFVANSRHVAERIARSYGRGAQVVYPPVDVPESPPAAGPREDYYVCLGHHVPYKRLDLAVEATRVLGRRLVIIGDGPATRRVDPGRDRHVQLLGWQPDEIIDTHLRRARGLLFPGEEDFGLVPVEALARGCPVIAYGVGGAAETITEAQTGVLFERQTPSGLIEAIERFERLAFDALRLHADAMRFCRLRFLREMRAVLAAALERKSAGKPKDAAPGCEDHQQSCT